MNAFSLVKVSLFNIMFMWGDTITQEIYTHVVPNNSFLWMYEWVLTVSTKSDHTYYHPDWMVVNTALEKALPKFLKSFLSLFVVQLVSARLGSSYFSPSECDYLNRTVAPRWIGRAWWTMATNFVRRIWPGFCLVEDTEHLDLRNHCSFSCRPRCDNLHRSCKLPRNAKVKKKNSNQYVTIVKRS